MQIWSIKSSFKGILHLPGQKIILSWCVLVLGSIDGENKQARTTNTSVILVPFCEITQTSIGLIPQMDHL